MDKVRAAILGTDGSGSLYRWLRRQHDELVELLSQVPRPDWRKITAALSDEKLLDATGKPPTPERVRQTWVKVRKDVELARGKKARSQEAALAVSGHTQRARPGSAVKSPEKATEGSDVLASFKERLKKGG